MQQRSHLYPLKSRERGGDRDCKGHTDNLLISWALEQVAQRGWGASCPGDVQEPFESNPEQRAIGDPA